MKALEKHSQHGRENHLLGLDLLRFFSAALVVFNHFGIFSKARPDVGIPFAFPMLTFASGFGWVGVQIFFVISGFVIALSARGATPTGFLKRRAVRVFPALWICSCISLAALMTTSPPMHELIGEFLRSVTLFPQGPYIDGAIWTLVVEAVFYGLIWAVLWMRWFERLDRIAAILGISSAVFLAVYGLAEFSHDVPLLEQVANIMGRFAFKLALLRHGVFFALGIMMWLGFEYGFTRKLKLQMMVVVIFGAVEISILAHSADRSASALLIASPVIIWGAGVAALFASVRFQAVIREKLQRQGRLVQRLGLMTFPLYLNHYSLGRVLVFSLVSSGLGEFSSFAIAFTLICGSSWLIMLYPEQMLQSALRRLFGLNSRYLRESPKLSEISSFEENVGRASLP